MNLKDEIEKPLIALENLAEQVDICNQRIVNFFRDLYRSPMETLNGFYGDLTC
jgi:hypothetical protein